MRRALEVAAATDNPELDVPVGAVVYDSQGRELAHARNARERTADPTAHAEIVALRQAAAGASRWRLDGCVLVVTVEPCTMCAGALVNARITRLVYGCPNPKAGAVDTLYSIPTDVRLNHRMEVTRGVLAEDAAGLLRGFFERLRKAGEGR